MKSLWKILFFLLPLCMFLLFGLRGFSDTDAGFIPGMAWRIVQGQTPHLDFAYVRPPLSLYVHAAVQALLPEAWEMRGERLLFYAMMAAISYFAVFAFRALLNEEIAGVHPWMLACLGFVLSVHNFPAMPWHTVDALCFAAAGFFLISPFRNRNPGTLGYIAGLFCLLLAAACKQPFALLFPVFVLLPLLYADKTRFLQGIGLSGILILSGITVTFAFPNFIHAFLNDVSGQTSLYDLAHAGLWMYAKWAILLLPGIAAYFLILQKPGRFANLLQLSVPLIFLALLSANAAMQFWKEGFKGMFLGAPQFLFLLALFSILTRADKDRKKKIMLAASLLLPWCASISWGYENPSLGFAFLLIPVLSYFSEIQLRFLPHAFAGCCAIVFAMNCYPYRDAALWNCTYDGGELFPALSGIRLGKENFEKTKSFKELTFEYAGPFIVVPGFPHAHYLKRELPALGSDWEHNAEMNYAKRKEEFLHQLDENIRYVFLEKGKEEQLRSHEKWGSDFSAFIAANWILKGEDEWFYVYRNPHDN